MNHAYFNATTDGFVSQLPPSSASQGEQRRTSLPENIQFSYTTRFVEEAWKNGSEFFLQCGEGIQPQSGDVVIAKIQKISSHKRIETPQSRKAILFQNRIVALAYGSRYAADQFLSEVPQNLDHCHMVAAGGIAGNVVLQHDRMKEPTAIEPLGLLSTANGIVNIADFAPLHVVKNAEPAERHPKVFAVLGTAMNSGKSTTMACLVNGLTAAGLKVGAGKATGTGAGNDRMLYHDAGANEVIDFTDFGVGTTFKLDYSEVRDLMLTMINHLAQNNDVVVIEIADGIYQGETARLLADERVNGDVDSTIFAAVDALGAVGGAQAIQNAGLTLSAVSGIVTSSPLAADEAAKGIKEVSDAPVIPTYDLCEPEIASSLL